jgi:peptidoglycan-associated lipoprotein
MQTFSGAYAVRLIAAGLLAASIAACASRQPAVPPSLPTERGPAVVAVPEPPAPPRPPAPVGPAPGSAEDFRVTVNERVFFGLDRHDLSPEARVTLERQAAWLRTYPGVSVLIEGNADERGTREYNLALGARRAQAVKEYLVGLGVPAGRIDTVSYGKERPIDPRANDDGWAINRNARTALVSGVVG